MKKKMKLNRNGRILRVFAILLVMLMIVSNLLVETQAKTSKKNSEKTDQRSECAYKNKEKIYLNKNWKYADHAKITSGYAVFYKAKKNRKGGSRNEQCRFQEDTLPPGWFRKGNRRNNKRRLNESNRSLRWNDVSRRNQGKYHHAKNGKDSEEKASGGRL